MNINLTLVLQMIVFAVLVWFTMSFVWPKLMGALEERSRKIAMGLAAAEKGQQELAQAEQRIAVMIREAQERANQIVDQAQRRANDMIEQARHSAGEEGQRMLVNAQQQIELEANRARDSLRRDIGQLAIETAAKVLEREVDARAHADLISKLAAQI
ncbi:MAG TPA: F0F1 ATP synthase subunit B [Steroidobacteraceae bacterium]|nr:F0F1 ATP synthase subunit B [Steroidobacteraceae bacterium]